MAKMTGLVFTLAFLPFYTNGKIFFSLLIYDLKGRCAECNITTSEAVSWPRENPYVLVANSTRCFSFKMSLITMTNDMSYLEKPSYFRKQNSKGFLIIKS